MALCNSINAEPNSEKFLECLKILLESKANVDATTKQK